jgi:hypothetical protein
MRGAGIAVLSQLCGRQVCAYGVVAEYVVNFLALGSMAGVQDR